MRGKKMHQLLQSDLVWTHKWPFQGLSDLHLGNQKVTLKKLVYKKERERESEWVSGWVSEWVCCHACQPATAPALSLPRSLSYYPLDKRKELVLVCAGVSPGTFKRCGRPGASGGYGKEMQLFKISAKEKNIRQPGKSARKQSNHALWRIIVHIHWAKWTLAVAHLPHNAPCATDFF